MLKRLHRVSIVALTAALAGGIGSQANGQAPQETPNPNQAEITRMQHQEALIQQQTALIEQQTALEKQRGDMINQRMEQLGLSNPATGTTELKEKGGQFEGWLLSANAINYAAARIHDGFGNHQGRIVLLDGNEAFDLSLPRTMSMRLDSLAARIAQARRTACPSALDQLNNLLNSERALGMTESSGLGLVEAIPYVGAVLGALRTDTTITGFEGPTDATLVINALAQTPAPAGQLRVIPTAVSRIPEDSDLAKKWDEVSAARAQLAVCRASIPAAQTARIAAVDQAIAEVNGFETRDIAGGTGASPFVQALRLEALASDRNLRVARIFVVKSGGSLIERQNLLTMLGFPAVSVTGGAVVGWRMFDASNGTLVGGGNLVCLTDLTRLRHVQRGQFRTPNCQYYHSGRVAANAQAGGASR